MAPHYRWTRRLSSATMTRRALFWAFLKAGLEEDLVDDRHVLGGDQLLYACTLDG